MAGGWREKIHFLIILMSYDGDACRVVQDVTFHLKQDEVYGFGDLRILAPRPGGL